MFQAEDGIRYLVRSRGLGDVYKRQGLVDPSVFVSKTFAFTDGQQAFEAALQPENFRVVVKF